MWWNRWKAALLVVALVVVAGVISVWRLPYTALAPTQFRRPAPMPSQVEGRDAAWRQDLDYLARELPRLHVNAFHTTDRASFMAAVADLDAAIPSLRDDEIIVRLLALVASVGDGHTALDATPLFAQTIYPVRLVKLEEDWAVWSATAEHADLVGTRLVQIDGTPVDALLALFTPLISADNDAQRQAIAPSLLTSPAIVAALGIVADADAPRFAFVDPTGERISRTLTPIPVSTDPSGWFTLRDRFPVDPLPLSLTQRDQWYWFTPLSDEGALYFQYNVCAEMPDRPFAPFTQELFATLDAQAIDRVIIDLRYNGGGNSAVIKPFLEGLTARPGLSVYTLIGRNTFSSALMNAIELKNQGAILVGEPTGGRPNHYGEVRNFTLPNSELRVSYSTRYFRMLPDADPPALAPDLPVPNTLANQMAGTDAVLATALAHSR